ncbi:MAG: hypothetical protein F6J86_04095 [Symploca sp. SIO1B1]|nr:hypothetical protein [Symploca sp. SIO1B1]
MSDEDLRQLVANNAKATGDLRASISDLRDIAAFNERHILRLEAKKVDTWGDILRGNKMNDSDF